MHEMDLLPVMYAAQINLIVEPSKSQLIYFHEDIKPLSNEVKTFLSTTNITLETKAAIILGSPVGCSDDATKSLVNKILSKHDPFFVSIKHPSMPVQLALILL